MEGGEEISDQLKNYKVWNSVIHLGLTPQSIYNFGTYSVRAKEKESKINYDAKILEKGCFSIVLEKVLINGKRSF